MEETSQTRVHLNISINTECFEKHANTKFGIDQAMTVQQRDEKLNALKEIIRENPNWKKHLRIPKPERN